MKKIAKYVGFVSAAIIINLLLWNIGQDCLSEKINGDFNQFDFETLLFVGIFTLILMSVFRGLIGLLNFIPKTRKAKLLLAATVTALIFGNTTLSNLKHTATSVFTDQSDRAALCEKIQDANYLASGSTASELTLKEYNQIRNLLPVPSISGKSYDIYYF
ncbi:MAG: hypothetical protein AAGI23_15355 [Bacteroidota bacterium]